MTDLAQWRKTNDQYLTAAVRWIRWRLEQLIKPTPAPAAAPAMQTAQTARATAADATPLSFTERLLGRTAGPAPAAAAGVNDGEIAQVVAAMHDAEAADPPPAALILSERFGLSQFEREILLLCAAMELDTRTAALCALAQADAQRPYPTFALALALFDDPTWEALSPERPLRYWRLLEINQPGALPLTASALRADERIVNYLKGLNYLDDRLSPLLSPLAHAAADLPASQQNAADQITHQLRHADGHVPIVQLIGPDSASKQIVAQQVAAELGLQVLRLPIALVPAHAAELDTVARLWQRESNLLPLALYLDAHEADAAALEGPASLNRFVARSQTLIFLDVREVWARLERDSLTADIERPLPPEQQQAWRTALNSIGAEDAAHLTGQFNLNVPEIEQVARLVAANPIEHGPTPFDQAWRTCLIRTRPRLDALAQRLEPRATWDLLVLPEAETQLLKQITAQVAQRNRVYDEWGFRARMNRGLGISALFAGDSGTGKTMAAEVIAQALHLNLYRIDLSAVVNKYIGETEKNLRRVFDAAEDGGAILFFDEADALFGKRSEVKDSHDRYANIESSYLLQRMEAYRGLAILATNMRSALDQAFMRRLRFIVNFPFPGTPERKAMWSRVFPPETPCEGLDFDRLARFNLTGGSIHNVALNAAFLAAQANSPVTQSLIFDAVRAEFRKLERPISEAEFK